MSDMDKLYNACRVGDLEEVKRLHASGADIHAMDDYAFTWACQFGQLEVMKYLVENGADVHAMGDWALHSSIYHGRLEVVEYLQMIIRKEKLENLLW